MIPTIVVLNQAMEHYMYHSRLTGNQASVMSTP